MSIRDENGNIEWQHVPSSGPAIVVFAKGFTEACEKIDAIVAQRHAAIIADMERVELEDRQKEKVVQYESLVSVLSQFLSDNLFYPDDGDFIVISKDGIRISPDNGRCYHCDTDVDWEVTSQ